MLQKLRLYFHRLRLKQKIKSVSHEREVVNLHQAKHIGVLYMQTNAQDQQVIDKLVQSLKANGRKVEVLSFTRDKKKLIGPDEPVFGPKSLNWYYQPSDAKVNAFINTPFDILINAFVGNNLPLEYVGLLSKAKYRVGEYHPDKTEAAELMVNCGEQKSLAYLVKQISFFLTAINK